MSKCGLFLVFVWLSSTFIKEISNPATGTSTVVFSSKAAMAKFILANLQWKQQFCYWIQQTDVEAFDDEILQDQAIKIIPIKIYITQGYLRGGWGTLEVAILKCPILNFGCRSIFSTIFKSEEPCMHYPLLNTNPELKQF